MKTWMIVLMLFSLNVLAGTSVVCRPDGTCDIVITQDDGSGGNNGWPKIDW